MIIKAEVKYSMLNAPTSILTFEARVPHLVNGNGFRHAIVDPP